MTVTCEEMQCLIGPLISLDRSSSPDRLHNSSNPAVALSKGLVCAARNCSILQFCHLYELYLPAGSFLGAQAPVPSDSLSPQLGDSYNNLKALLQNSSGRSCRIHEECDQLILGDKTFRNQFVNKQPCPEHRACHTSRSPVIDYMTDLLSVLAACL